MKVSELYDEMLKLLKDGKGNYDVMIRVTDDKVGYVELTSVNNAYLDWRE